MVEVVDQVDDEVKRKFDKILDEEPKDVTDEGTDRDINKGDGSNVASENSKEDDNMSNENQTKTEKQKAFDNVDWGNVKNGAKRGLKEVGKTALNVGVAAAGTYLGMRAYDKWARGEAEVDADDVVDFEDAQAQ